MSLADSDANRIVRYLSGACSATEARELEVWLAADPVRQREFEAMRRVWGLTNGVPSSDVVDALWHDMVKQVRQENGAEVPVRRLPAPTMAVPLSRYEATGKSRTWRRVALGLAAAASVTVAVGIGLRTYRDGSKTSSLPPQIASRYQEYRTTRGQRATIRLSDGTRVDLGAASVLRVNRVATGPRRVELDGEAVFVVKHNAARPFTVVARNSAVEDLGTVFGVRAYRDDASVRVVVTEGKVALRPDRTKSDTAAVLLPGDIGYIERGQRTEVRRGTAAQPYLGWTNGRLYFHNATLAEVGKDLERWYDVKLKFASPSVAGRRVLLSVPIGSLTDALNAITGPLGLVYELDGNVAVLRPR